MGMQLQMGPETEKGTTMEWKLELELEKQRER
jgi:hypothetical protein